MTRHTLSPTGASDKMNKLLVVTVLVALLALSKWSLR